MTGLTSDISSWRVLIVEDKADNLKLITLVLESRQATVIGLTDSKKALEAVETLDPNLILLDLAMPVINGWELHKQLRAQPALDHVPIIALTALSMPRDIERGKLAGFDGYITKPYRSEGILQELKACVIEFLAR